MTKFNVLEFIANNSGLSIAEAIEKAYELGKAEMQQCEGEKPNCTECRYYDHEKHHCPRFCRVIENTMAEITSEQTRWIPVSERLPEDGTWNLFTDGKTISVERYKFDAIDHFFPNGRWFSLEEAVAWMPLPERYKEEEE